MRLLRYFVKRLLTVIPLFIGIIFIIFVIIRLLPGNPAYRLAGAFTFEGTVENLIKQMGLDKPIWQEIPDLYRRCTERRFGPVVVHQSACAQGSDHALPGDPGTDNPEPGLVPGDRYFIGALAAVSPKGVVSKISSGYGLMAGALAEFLGRVDAGLHLLLPVTLGSVTAPMGRLNLMTVPPPRFTGFLLLDSLLDWNWSAFA